MIRVANSADAEWGTSGAPCLAENSPSLIEDKKIKKEILSSILYFNDINESRTNNIKKVFKSNQYNLNITNLDFLSEEQTRREMAPKVGYARDGTDDPGFDLIVANPPYAKLLKDGRRASKNHNLISLFIEGALNLLKKEGYILFIIPDN